MSTPRSPDVPRGLAVWLLACAWLFAAGAAFAETRSELATEREHLLAEQRTLIDRYERELAACSERFLVTACIDESNRQRRVALAPVRERLLQIDETERQRRASERRAALADKQKLLEERMAGALAAEQAASAASAAIASSPRQRMLPKSAPLVLPSDRSTQEAQRNQEAAARAREAERRQAQARERQARVARRLAEREAAKGPMPALPVPPADSAPR